MKIYHTETQEDYDALMVELERQGCKWSTGDKTTELTKNWKRNSNKTCVSVDKKVVMYDKKSYYTRKHPEVPIQKYKAKADDKMRFTKENVEKVIDDYFLQADLEPCGDLIADIHNLDDTPEKVVVKKFVAEFYEECANATLEFLITQLEATDSRSELGEWYRSCRGRHRNGRANAQKVIAKMTLYGYEVEKEPLYYIPLPHLKTTDGIQQVLSKRKGDKNYFASRPNENLKQRFTKEEIAQVPEIYKPYAKPIEEEEE